ncbi:MAG: DNA methyltransferase, partial [Nanoarchaeota archaeon]
MYKIEEITNKILQGNSLEQLKLIPSESIDTIMCSPPYWAVRDYKIREDIIWDGDSNCKHDFKLIKRKLHGGSTSEEWANTVNKGMQKSDWITEDGFCSKCRAWKGQLGLEPTYNLFIKHLCDIFVEVKRVLKKSGTCWVNMGDSYSGNMGKRDGWTDNKMGFTKDQGIKSGVALINKQFEYSLPNKSLCLIPFRFATAMVDMGWICRNVVIWHKPNCMPSSVKDRFTVDFEYVFFFTKNKDYYFEPQYEPLAESSLTDPRLDKGREEHMGKSADKTYSMNATVINSYGRNKRAVWTITTQPSSEYYC